jgi:transcriptional regulator with XRE-family HTH domain
MADRDGVTFAWLLRRLRTEEGKTQEELADAAGVSPRTISDLERGVNRRAQSETARLLADALQLTGPVRLAFEAAARGHGRDGSASSIEELRTASILASVATQGGTRNPVGPILRQLREAAGLTQESVASNLNWSPSRVSRIENGITVLPDSELARLLELYNADEDLKNEIIAAVELLKFAAAEARSKESTESVDLDSSLLIPGYVTEAPEGPDLLGVKQDASALAVLLTARNLNPPLALGLFGDWGSGKTFFMKTLERKIAALADDAADEDNLFCRSVVSVWFNAWHYSRADLWTSLIHHIFVSLLGDTSAPQRILDDALAEVEGIREVKTAAAFRVAEAQHNTERAIEGLNRVAIEHEQANRDASHVNSKDIWAAVSADDEILQDFNEAASMIGFPAVGANAREISEAVAEASEAVSSARFLMATAGRWKSPLILGLTIAALISVGGLIVASKVGWTHNWLGPVFASISQLAAICSGAAVWIARQASLARQLLEPAEKIKRQLNERLAAARAIQQEEILSARERLRQAEIELEHARDALKMAEGREAAAQEQLHDLSGPRLLERYLSERIQSVEYNRYLGPVALAHRDLRDLESYLRSAADGHGRLIDRIVLYIDDLDRCSTAIVVKVLEAVHLLLALPLFVVVVGVDSRWLAKSLSEERSLLTLSRAPSAGDAYLSATSADYLDKIFQLSYELPEITPERCSDLLTYAALQTQPQVPYVQANSTRSPFMPVASQASDSIQASEDTYDLSNGHKLQDDHIAASEALVLDTQELQLLKVVAPLLSSSPRRAKRFVNIYRVIKSRAMADPLTRQRLNDTGAASMMILAALAVGLPEVVPTMIHSAAEGQSVRQWLETRVAPSAIGAESRRLTAFLSSAHSLADIPILDILQWISIVRPYAWPPAAGAITLEELQISSAKTCEEIAVTGRALMPRTGSSAGALRGRVDVQTAEPD